LLAVHVDKAWSRKVLGTRRGRRKVELLVYDVLRTMKEMYKSKCIGECRLGLLLY
jgi:hypothetical protein